ncbi:CatB-related O-acetyltransferase [Clostridium perfringens]|uniref:CatB-related O-acetyltransferase n=1 Tax=Clostridium perfringens TaxID=1502 RepID=UPI00016BC6D4|nr:CatB-related O-acetyltransferase [Clostridium perfringens]EDT78763.1 acetyltransferase, cyse/laca/lpxa/nodl family [Clostridium perfringens NCTC 8239]ELC8384331.1 CatB-related O-acetyltransferase [Clostridium perfringens]ELC8431685.1 CatB-related O-acetyltransferase [Clostridium perfringens]MCX0358846.1 CatB-related O-acetyltransferase [Clostridium perfringens]MCX0419107.1 CatB-related O-acetyltransferase [Clostridium perfringens]
MIFNKLKSIFKLYNQKKQWRKINKHNYTSVNRITDLKKIRVGMKSYGPLNVYTWGSENEELIIGNYVSIASDVKFILGGNHRYDIFSTYPFKVKLGLEEIEAYSNGKIKICDDVWIGMNTTIMSGVTIGQGAIIAAGSVVTKDVEPYSIVGGNPCKLIKYRFDTDLINKIKNINMEELDSENIKKNIDIFYKSLDDSVLSEIIERTNL